MYRILRSNNSGIRLKLIFQIIFHLLSKNLEVYNLKFNVTDYQIVLEIMILKFGDLRDCLK